MKKVKGKENQRGGRVENWAREMESQRSVHSEVRVTPRLGTGRAVHLDAGGGVR